MPGDGEDTRERRGGAMGETRAQTHKHPRTPTPEKTPTPGNATPQSARTPRRLAATSSHLQPGRSGERGRNLVRSKVVRVGAKRITTSRPLPRARKFAALLSLPSFISQTIPTGRGISCATQTGTRDGPRERRPVHARPCYSAPPPRDRPAGEHSCLRRPQGLAPPVPCARRPDGQPQRAHTTCSLGRESNAPAADASHGRPKTRTPRAAPGTNVMRLAAPPPHLLRVGDGQVGKPWGIVALAVQAVQGPKIVC